MGASRFGSTLQDERAGRKDTPQDAVAGTVTLTPAGHEDVALGLPAAAGPRAAGRYARPAACSSSTSAGSIASAISSRSAATSGVLTNPKSTWSR